MSKAVIATPSTTEGPAASNSEAVAAAWVYTSSAYVRMLNRSVTVISPAVMTATQIAAMPTAGIAPRSDTRKKTCLADPSNKACSSSSGSTNLNPIPTMPTTQGKAARL